MTWTQPDTPNPGNEEYADVTIANGASLSSGLDLGWMSLVGILIPATWTAAGLAFQASPDGVTYGKLLDGTGTEVTVAAVAGGEYVALDPAKFFGVRYLKVRSGTEGSPVAQGAARTLRLVGRGL